MSEERGRRAPRRRQNGAGRKREAGNEVPKASERTCRGAGRAAWRPEGYLSLFTPGPATGVMGMARGLAPRLRGKPIPYLFTPCSDRYGLILPREGPWRSLPAPRLQLPAKEKRRTPEARGCNRPQTRGDTRPVTYWAVTPPEAAAPVPCCPSEPGLPSSSSPQQGPSVGFPPPEATGGGRAVHEGPTMRGTHPARPHYPDDNGVPQARAWQEWDFLWGADEGGCGDFQIGAPAGRLASERQKGTETDLLRRASDPQTLPSRGSGWGEKAEQLRSPELGKGRLPRDPIPLWSRPNPAGSALGKNSKAQIAGQ